jgi:hypothetical protein
MIVSSANPVQFWPDNCTTYNENEAFGVHPVCWCQPFNNDDEIIIHVTDNSLTPLTLVILSASGATVEEITFTQIANRAFQASFIPDDVGISDAQVALEIRYNGQRLYKSDCLDIKQDHSGTKLLEYSNTRNYAGLDYSQSSPEHSFFIRIPCRFFHERFPEEDDAIELTSSVITTASQVKSQKLLEVVHAPYYFHRKLMEILKHFTLEIDNTQWKKEEPYDQNPGSKRWPLKSATCWLTDKNSMVRNTL